MFYGVMLSQRENKDFRDCLHEGRPVTREIVAYLGKARDPPLCSLMRSFLQDYWEGFQNCLGQGCAGCFNKPRQCPGTVRTVAGTIQQYGTVGCIVHLGMPLNPTAKGGIFGPAMILSDFAGGVCWRR